MVLARKLSLFVVVAAATALLPTLSRPAAAAGPCDPPTNPIACENSLPGDPQSQWDVTGSGSSSIQGFAADISYNQGQTAQFKVDTPATSYRLDIYRMGFYGGDGARKVSTVLPSASLPQSQPACMTQSATGLVDCGSWAVSATWAIPSDAVSGVYFAKLVRTDGTAGSSHIVFIVRDDTGGSAILLQTSDTTWQAYNRWAEGGQTSSLYTSSISPAGRAYKVSYNRPFATRDCCAHDFVFSAEYPMVRWLEANGYDVSYFTGVDTDRRGSELLEHQVFMSQGHDEYWSGGQRASVEAARNAGVNLAFFSGNEMFWKTRWESSISAPATSYRTLVTYKESKANAKIDPDPAWTGTWRDPRFSPPSDGGRPENAVTGTLFTVNGPRNDALAVPQADGLMRLWRDTSVATLAAGQVATFADGTLGYEWDEDIDNGFRPPGLIQLSTATVSVGTKIEDYCCTFAPGNATHHLTLYRHSSGALVFGAGTVQWSFGLDATHDGSTAPADVRMQQATVNLFADMGVQPITLQAGLVAATASADTTAPTATITSPPANANVSVGIATTVTGTASDTGGRVGAVEVSTDGGATWHPAQGRASWSYQWTPSAVGPTTILARVADDSANLGPNSAGVPVVVAGGCPCSIWASSATPGAIAADTKSVEVGLKFRADADGFITGIRFYKGAANTGTHIGSLWTRTGTRLAKATFTGETGSGWQQVTFASPVAVTANTTYVASYHTNVGRYAKDANYFATTGVDSSPLHALKSGVDGGNGVFKYGAKPVFPNATSNATNYWVDVVYSGNATDTTPPTVNTRTPASGASGVAVTTNATATFNEDVQPGTISFTLTGPGGSVAATQSYDSASKTATLNPSADLSPGATYTATVSDAADIAGNAMTAPSSWSFTTAAASSCPCTIWGSSATPAVIAADANAIEVGLKFRADADGFITAIRFYKGSTNTGTHVGSLWTSTGALLGQATFTGESASGWQQVTFTSPIAVTANTTYVASYHTNVGHYALNKGYFATSGFDNPPLHALMTGVDGSNGIYLYSATPAFPTSPTTNSNNYWVDVVYTS